MAKPKKIEKWVEIPCRFYVRATTQQAFDEAVRRIPGYVWLDTIFGFQGESVSIQSAKAKERD